MKLRVIVEVVDEKTRKGTRRTRELEIPGRILNVHKALCESRKDLRAFVADDVMSGALSAVSNQRNTTDSIGEALLSEPAPMPASQARQVSSGSPVRAPRSKVESFLGLDVIEHMDGMEARSRGAQQAQEAQEAAAMAAAGIPAPPGFEWGKIGYGPDRGR